MLFISDNVEWEGLYEKSSVFIDFCGYWFAFGSFYYKGCRNSNWRVYLFLDYAFGDVFAPKEVKGNNSLKLFLQSIGKSKIYRNICVVLCVIFIVFSTIALLSSM